MVQIGNQPEDHAEHNSSVKVSETTIFLILVAALGAMILIAALVNGWTLPTTN